MRKDVVQPVRKLVGVDISKPVLHMRVDDQLDETQNLAAQVEGISEAAALALLRCQRLDGLEVEVVVEVQVGEALALDKQVEHVVALATHLKADFDPVKLGPLEKLCRLKLAE